MRGMNMRGKAEAIDASYVSTTLINCPSAYLEERECDYSTQDNMAT